MFSFWNELPDDLRVPLLKGGVGRLHLLSVAEVALQKAGGAPPDAALRFLRLGGGLMRAAWESAPLEGRTARQMLALHGAYPFLPTQVARLAAHLADHDTPPADAGALLQVLHSRDAKAICRHLERMRRLEPRNLFWTRQAALMGLAEGCLDWFEGWLAGAEGIPGPLLDAMRADVAFAREAWTDAAAGYARAFRGLPLDVWRIRMGEASYRAGDAGAALATWQAVLPVMPWQVNLLLRCDDVARGRDRPGDIPAGRGAVLLYSWNKADCLPQTLAALAGSDLGDARVIVLDNGSTDGTQAVLAEYHARLGDRLLVVTLPCNVGAPAARNWLLTLPETRSCDWLVFLDDDAVVPPDWLRLFGAAMTAYPGHGVYGCRVVDHAVPMMLQSVDLHLDRGVPSGEPGGPVPVYERRFSVSDIQHQELDFGAFGYMRPCVSVTGCCHLFRREAIDRCGHFDVRFSPSQYDDLEHDIRHAVAGDLPVYQGHLRVRHMKRSGRAAQADAVHLSSAWANLYKLQMRYTPEDFDAVRQREHEALLADVLQRCSG